MVFLSFHANQFQRYAEKRGEKTAADDLNENLVEINERESFQKEKGDAVKTDGSDDELGETTPFHRLSRGSKVLIVIGRAEHIDQPRREKTGERQRAVSVSAQAAIPGVLAKMSINKPRTKPDRTYAQRGVETGRMSRK